MQLERNSQNFGGNTAGFFYGDGASAHLHTGLSFEQFVMKSRMHCFTVTLQPSSASFETLSCY
jgi:hypothetical protein